MTQTPKKTTVKQPGKPAGKKPPVKKKPAARKKPVPGLTGRLNILSVMQKALMDYPAENDDVWALDLAAGTGYAPPATICITCNEVPVAWLEIPEKERSVTIVLEHEKLGFCPHSKGRTHAHSMRDLRKLADITDRVDTIISAVGDFE